MPFGPLMPSSAAVAGIDLELDQRPAGAQQLDLVNPARVLALQFDFHDLPRIVALDPFQDRAQGQDLAGLQRLAGAIVIVPVAGHGAAPAPRSASSSAAESAAAIRSTVFCLTSRYPEWVFP